MENNCKKLRRVGDTERAGGHVSPILCEVKRKKGNKRKKRKGFKAETIKRLQTFKHFSCRSIVTDSTFQRSMALHFEIYFAGSFATNRSYLLADIGLLIREKSSKQITFEDQVPAIYLIIILHLHLFTYDYSLADFIKNCTSNLLLLT